MAITVIEDTTRALMSPTITPSPNMTSGLSINDEDCITVDVVDVVSDC